LLVYSLMLLGAVVDIGRFVIDLSRESGLLHGKQLLLTLVVRYFGVFQLLFRLEARSFLSSLLLFAYLGKMIHCIDECETRLIV